MVVPGTVAGWGPWLVVRDGAAATGGWRAAGVVLLLIGASIYLWCLWDFASFGRGTPAPIDAPKKLVVRGLYRRTRNPMYVGVLTALLGWAALFRETDMLVYAAIVWTCVHVFVLVYEEPHLSKVFGDDYARYRARVGRWLPRLPGE